mgnify:CR=1 FL=1
MLLEVNNVRKVYTTRLSTQSTEALKNVNFAVDNGEYVAIMGESGSGKTTLLNIIATFDKATSGNVNLNNLDLSKLKDKDLANFRRDNLGFVFQDFQLFPHLSVLDNLTLSPIKTMSMEKEVAEKKARGLLEQLGLAGHADAFPFSLSGGQKQRVALARAMMINPEVIGYDEPTSALDPELRLEVEKLILQNKERGMTQIVVTHDLQFAENIADQILKVDPK